MQIRWVSRQLRQVIDVHFLPTITKLSAQLLIEILLPELLLLTNLRELALAPLHEDALQPVLLFNTLSKLERLNLRNLWQHRRIIREQLQLLPTRLISLKLDRNSDTEEETLTKLTQLQTLGILRSGLISDEALATMTSLTRLDVRENIFISDKALVSLTNLTVLRISQNAHISDCSIGQLTRLSRLELVEGSPDVTDKALIRLTRLRRLDLEENDSITDAALVALRSSLVRLGLKYNRVITDAGLSVLTGLTNLDITGAAYITGDALLPLTRLKNLLLRDSEQIPDETQDFLRNKRNVLIQYWH
jgi:hypothetical protein